MIEPGKKIADIPEFAPVVKVVDTPIKADIIAYFYDNPDEDDDATGIARRIEEDRIKLVEQNLAELARAGLFKAKVGGVTRSDFYSFTPDAPMKEALELIFKKAGTRDYWSEFRGHLRGREAGQKSKKKMLFIGLGVILLAILAGAGYFIAGQIGAQKRAEKEKALTAGSGVQEISYSNGNLKSKIEYFSGDRNGPFTTWFENGKKMAEGSYKNNIPDGEWRFWDNTGKEIKVVTYREGRAVLK
ncbi:MAG: hypothetical protein U9N73_09005 [Candidatus Auribacterota bacterium]|nr:hypothetical protein [Candidatus Auribacterota bacterium]